jgi:phosphate transport system substrate-binding protein
MFSKLLLFAVVGVWFVPGLSAKERPIEVDPTLPVYAKKPGISGTLSSVGSDTLNNLLALWSEGFRRKYPNVNLQVEGKGSSTAPTALIEGNAQLGPMSRPMKLEEIENFESRKGYPPTAVGIAFDALAIFVHKDNPIATLSLTSLDAIFSITRRGGFGKTVRTWGDLDPESPIASYPISLYGRNSASGTYGFFKQHALFKGDFKKTVKEQPGSSSVVMAITENVAGIGYSGIGYRTSSVRMVPLSVRAGEPAFTPNAENVLSGDYPMSRMLLVYVDKPPGKPLPTVVEEFLRYVLSRDGQEVVVKSGYIPLSLEAAADELAKLTGQTPGPKP